ncbi:helix-hairpin-helix domain-containing protein [Aggregatibacter aphrophilus]|uniref:helix-hairpin-helix domain-containing protein n=1 Tax=Aggregatibacter aphrophilus TaxID=732 RepID=UPI001EF5EDBF|nr:helix-hairpin-helix domain-containing protein [Aggregatibacter aphrophilus]
MNPKKVKRSHLTKLTDLPNIGKATEADLIRLGMRMPHDLLGRNAYQMYDDLCRITGQKHDPCVIDVFLSIVDFINGGEPRRIGGNSQHNARRI